MDPEELLGMLGEEEGEEELDFGGSVIRELGSSLEKHHPYNETLPAETFAAPETDDPEMEAFAGYVEDRGTEPPEPMKNFTPDDAMQQQAMRDILQERMKARRESSERYQQSAREMNKELFS